MININYNKSLEIAKSLYHGGFYNEALIEFQKIKELNPTKDTSYCYIIFCLEELEEYENMLAVANEMIEKNLYLAFAYEAKGCALNTLKKYEEGVEFLKEGIKLTENNIEEKSRFINLHAILGENYFKQNKFKLAKKYYKKAVELDIDNPKYYYDYGNVLFKLKKNKEAITVYKKLLELNPFETNCLMQLGVLLEKTNVKESIYYYKKSLEYKQELSKELLYECHFRLGMLYLIQYDSEEEGLELLKKCLLINKYDNRNENIKKLLKIEEN